MFKRKHYKALNTGDVREGRKGRWKETKIRGKNGNMQREIATESYITTKSRKHIIKGRKLEIKR